MLEEKLKLIRKHDQEGRIRVMIIGLGSVGNYLLSYLLSSNDENLEIIVAGRNAEKLQCDSISPVLRLLSDARTSLMSLSTAHAILMTLIQLLHSYPSISLTS